MNSKKVATNKENDRDDIIQKGMKFMDRHIAGKNINETSVSFYLCFISSGVWILSPTFQG